MNKPGTTSNTAVTVIVVILVIIGGFYLYAKWDNARKQKEWYDSCIALKLESPQACYTDYQRFLNQ